MRANRLKFSRSILDFALDDAKRLQQVVGQADKRKLDEYLTSVRELEQRVQRRSQDESTSTKKMTKPEGIPDSYRDHLRLLADLLVMAFQVDATRISTLVFANEGSNRSYDFIGVPEGHHSLSHHRNDPEKQEKIKKINSGVLPLADLKNWFGFDIKNLVEIMKLETT